MEELKTYIRIFAVAYCDYKKTWRIPSWLNAESVTLDGHTQERNLDLVKVGEQIKNMILNGMQ